MASAAYAAVAFANGGYKRKQRLLIGGLALAVILIGFASVAAGSVAIAPLTEFRILAAHLPGGSLPASVPSTLDAILFQLRLPRVILVALAGLALASSGAAYQGLFHNPLADPYLVGVSAGAGLGATLVIPLQAANPWLGAWGVPLGAFLGAGVVVAVVYGLSRRESLASSSTLLLAGVAVGAFATAISTFVMMRLGQQMLQVLYFLLGGYQAPGWSALAVVTPPIAAGLLLVLLCSRSLNLLLFDEEQAAQLGVDVARVRLLVVIGATLMTAAAVAFSGLIGFVGLIVPHALRPFTGGDHRRLIPACALAGAAFLMLADLVARTATSPEELPLGVVTAFAGAPFFMYLLRRTQRRDAL